ncbi:MAG: cysteine desulfurase, partial [Streptococcus mitis]|nr:cysteine desulfurase [Streptococcus mitis]
AGISISTGSACTAGIVQSSHVLEAMYGANSDRLKQSVRISLSPQNTVEDLQTLAKTLNEIIVGYPYGI